MKKLFAVLVNATLLSSVASLGAYEITPMSEEEFLTYKSQHSCSCDEHIVFSHTNILPAANESTELEVAQVASEEEEEEIAVVEEQEEAALVAQEEVAPVAQEEVEQEEAAQVASEEEEILPVASEEQEEAAPVAQEEVVPAAQEEVAQSTPVEKKIKSVTTSIDSNVSVGQETVFSINQAEGVAKGSHEVRSSTSSSFVLSK